jgi:hypothetical protein
MLWLDLNQRIELPLLLIELRKRPLWLNTALSGDVIDRSFDFTGKVVGCVGQRNSN